MWSARGIILSQSSPTSTTTSSFQLLLLLLLKLQIIPLVYSHFSMTHKCVSYSRIYHILKILKRHILYGHHLKALGKYLKATRTYKTKWTQDVHTEHPRWCIMI